jgi:hypothetical protein
MGDRLSLVFDAVFVGLGALLLVRGRSGSRTGPGIVSRVDAFATRAAERSRWRDYSNTKRRVSAGLLTVEAAVISFGTSWLLSRGEDVGAAPWFIGGSLFVWMTAFIWSLTVDPTKAAKWGLLVGVPFIFVVGVGGSLLWLALTS